MTPERLQEIEKRVESMEKFAARVAPSVQSNQQLLKEMRELIAVARLNVRPCSLGHYCPRSKR